MGNESLNVDVHPRRPYPWARALLVVVLYVSLLIVLWHFPVEGVRAFFRNLIKGFGYLVAGLALIGLTVGVLFLLPPPLVAHDEEGESRDEADAGPRVGCVMPGRVLMVPDLCDEDRGLEIIDLLCDVLEGLDSESTFVADITVCAVAVIGEDEEDAEDLLQEVQARLEEEEILAHRPSSPRPS